MTQHQDRGAPGGCSPSGTEPTSTDAPSAQAPSPSPPKRRRGARDPSRVPAAQAARVFDVTLRTLSHWEERGWLVPVRENGRRYYAREAVERLWAERLGIVRMQWDVQIE